MWDRVKQIFAAVDTLYTIIDVLALLGIIFLPFSITSSDTLRGFIAAFAILGGVMGYFLTVRGWAGKGVAKCTHQRNIYLLLLWLPLVVFLGTLTALRADVAIKYPVVRPIREFLLTAMLITNFIVGISASFTSFFLVGAITLNSSTLAQSQRKKD